MVSTRQQCNHNADCSTRQPTSEGVCNVPQSHKGNSIAISTRASTSHSKEVTAPLARKTNILDLPPEIIQKIVSFNGYKAASDMRLVCKRMDDVCGSLLNSTFYKLQNAMLLRFQSIKSQMPRRESARRQHHLACESDIIETLHMRLTLLQMSFGKHIERKHCCFFAGEILDEVYRILYYIKVTPRLARPYKVTDELFDLTTMAMEYFKEKIEPRLPEITYFGTDFFGNDVIIPLSFTPGNRDKKEAVVKGSAPRRHFVRIDASSDDDKDSTSSGQPHYNMVLRKRMRKIKQGMKRCNSVLSEVKRELRNCKAKVVDQQKTMNGYAARLEENEKKSEEMSRKYGALMQELNKCKTELQYWRTKAPLTPACDACGNPIATIHKEDLQALHNQGVEVEIPKEEIADAEARKCEASTSQENREGHTEGKAIAENLKEAPSSSIRSKKEVGKLVDGKQSKAKVAGAITRRMDSTELGCNSRKDTTTIIGCSLGLRKEIVKDEVKTGRCVSNGNKRKLPPPPPESSVNSKKMRPVITLRSKAK